MQHRDTWIGRGRCVKCGAAAVVVACNDQMLDHKDASRFDYWAYCSNKTCEKHEGEGIYPGEPIPFCES